MLTKHILIAAFLGWMLLAAGHLPTKAAVWLTALAFVSFLVGLILAINPH